MGCFCRASAASLALQLPALDVSASLDLPGASLAMGLSAWLSARGLPAAPWQPDPAWLTLALPMPRLSVSAIATISALAQMRAQVLAQFGIDLLIPSQVNAFARIVASMNARLAVQLGAAAAIDPLGWVQLANLNAAIDQIQVALKAGLLVPVPSASLMLSLTMPGGSPIGQWGALLRPLRLLAPLIAASLQVNVGIAATAQFALALKALAQIKLPALAAPDLMASLSAALSATASLQASLGISPLALGLPAVQVQVQAKLTALLAVLSARFGLNLRLSGPTAASVLAALLADLLALLPKLPVAPGTLATAEVVQLAMQAQALAALDWQVPSLPAIQIGLSTATLAVQMQASLGIQAVLPAPCGSGCDAASLLRAVAAI
jgi:hypothetical protein